MATRIVKHGRTRGLFLALALRKANHAIAVSGIELLPFPSASWLLGETASVRRQRPISQMGLQKYVTDRVNFSALSINLRKYSWSRPPLFFMKNESCFFFKTAKRISQLYRKHAQKTSTYREPILTPGQQRRPRPAYNHASLYSWIPLPFTPGINARPST